MLSKQSITKEWLNLGKSVIIRFIEEFWLIFTYIKKVHLNNEESKTKKNIYF